MVGMAANAAVYAAAAVSCCVAAAALSALALASQARYGTYADTNDSALGPCQAPVCTSANTELSSSATEVYSALLAESAHRPSLVVTRPDRPRGRGRRVAAPPVAGAAAELGLALDQPEDVNAEPARRRIAAERPDAVCVCAFGALIKEPLLSEHEMFNVHPSLLPRWRGAAPIERAIMAGDEETGVAIMRVTAGLDSGPGVPAGAGADRCRRTRSARSRPGCRSSAASCSCALSTSAPPFVEQSEAGVTYAEKITAEDRLLDGSRRRRGRAGARVRALSPHVGARVSLPDGTLLGVMARRRVAGPDAAAPPGALARWTGVCCWRPRPASSSCSRCSPAAGARWRPRTTCAGIRCRPGARAPAARRPARAACHMDPKSPRAQGRGAAPPRRRPPVRGRAVTVGTARRCAFRVCRRVFEQGAYADRALVGEAATLDARDRALATRLCYGAIQRRGTLDHLIEGFAGRPMDALDAPVRAALRLGLYELLFLDGAPDRAVVAAAVELAKQSGGGGHGLVNAVLRRAVAEGPGLLAALRDDTPAAAAVRHSHPLWLVAPVVRAARRGRGAGSDGGRQRSGRECAAGEHARQ